MNSKLLPLLGLTLSLIACNSLGAPSPAAPTPGTPTPGAPTPGTPAPGTPAPPTNSPAGTGPALDGRTFLSIKVTDGGVDKPLVAGTVIRISFTDGQIGSSAGCNTIGGTYTVDADTLIFQGGGMTEMGCDPARHAQDDWLAAFLGSRPTIALNGNDLVLTSGATIITMLDKSRRRLPSMKDGSVDIEPGCNSGGGSYAVEGGAIRFTDLITTNMACMGAGGQVEGAVLAVLESHSITYAIDAGSLTLMAGDIGLQFSAD